MSADISIEVYGVEEAEEYFIEAAEKLAETVGARMADACQEIVDDAKSNAPVKTGEYQAGIGMQQTGPTNFTIFASAPHSSFIEYGTAPHIITPKNVSALHFELDGEEVFAKYVLHPGTAAQWIIHNAKKNGIPKLIEAIRAGVREALGR